MKLPSIIAVLAVFMVVLGSQAQGPIDQYPFTRGKITRVEPTNHQVEIKTPHGAVLFSVTDQTYLIAGKTRVSFDKLIVGDSVKLNYLTNATGQAVIRRLKIDQPEPAGTNSVAK